MIRKVLGTFFALIFSTIVLLVSFFSAASIKFAFEGPVVLGDEAGVKSVEYTIAYPGSVNPDHPLWPIKVLRDKLWMLLKFDDTKRAETALLLSDKRIGASKVLFEKSKPEIGFSTLTKAEKYLEEAFELERKAASQGKNTDAFLQKLARASLKHVEIMEEILLLSPEDAKPQIIRTMDYPKNIYRQVKKVLSDKGIDTYDNPFDWE